jgi:HTH-type transcriptional regulator, competence development regulator
MIQMNTDRDWLRRMAQREDEAIVSVGGWVTDLAQAGFPSRPSQPARSAFSRLLKLTRRERNLTAEAFARETGVELTELVSVENDGEYVPTHHTISRIADYLDLPETKLLVLAGLVAAPNTQMSEAAARFAARSEPVQQLTREEQQALAEFVGFLSNS